MRYMKPFRIIGIIFLCFFITSCNALPKQSNVPNSENIFYYYADLTHDGIDEVIAVDVTKIKADNQQMAEITVNDTNSNILWQRELFLSHVGQSSYSLCNWNGEYYLLYYLPWLGQDIGDYQYKLFYLEPEGAEIESASGSVSFESYPFSGEINFPVEDLITFAVDVNNYFSNSFLLVSTIDGTLDYSTTEEKIGYEENYKSLLNCYGIGVSDDLRKDLTAFENSIKDIQKNIAPN